MLYVVALVFLGGMVWTKGPSRVAMGILGAVLLITAVIKSFEG